MQRVCPTLFCLGKYRAQRDIESLNNIGAMILDKLLAIPADATNATVQGVEMQIITAEQADKMLEADTNDERIHECLLKNGRFLFESENGKLTTLYKVQN